MGNEKDILLCDLDAFYAAVEQRDKPELKGKPVIVGGSRGSRGVVSTCSYEAREYGIRSAMPIKQAAKLCPGAVYLPVNMKRYQEVSGQVKEIMESFTPDIETVSIDEAYLAVKSGAGYTTGESIRSAIKKEVDLPISIGVSVNKLLSKIACEVAKPDNIKAIWPDEVPGILWPMSVRVLPGVGPATEKKLKQHGFETVKDVANSPEKALVNLLGRNGAFLSRYAWGVDERKIESEGEVKSISEEITFPEDIDDREMMLTVVHEQASDVGYRLRSQKFYAKTVSIKLRFADFKTITRDLTLPAATDSDKVIYDSAKELFLRYCGNPPWRLVGVRVSGLTRSRQLSLFPEEPAGEKEEQLNKIKDSLRTKYGDKVLYGAKRLYKKRID